MEEMIAIAGRGHAKTRLAEAHIKWMIETIAFRQDEYDKLNVLACNKSKKLKAPNDQATRPS